LEILYRLFRVYILFLIFWFANFHFFLICFNIYFLFLHILFYFIFDAISLHNTIILHFGQDLIQQLSVSFLELFPQIAMKSIF